jgi:hypothetical protein
MTSPKYKLTISDIDKAQNIHKLERDGFTKEQIMKTMYRETDGATQRQREEIVSKLYDRRDR